MESTGLTMSNFFVNESELRRHFSTGLLGLAQMLYKQGRVHALHQTSDNSIITGRVEVDKNQEYIQNIRFHVQSERLAINGSCNCGRVSNCQHVAALLMEAMAQQKQGVLPVTTTVMPAKATITAAAPAAKTTTPTTPAPAAKTAPVTPTPVAKTAPTTRPIRSTTTDGAKSVGQILAMTHLIDHIAPAKGQASALAIPPDLADLIPEQLARTLSKESLEEVIASVRRLYRLPVPTAPKPTPATMPATAPATVTIISPTTAPKPTPATVTIIPPAGKTGIHSVPAKPVKPDKPVVNPLAAFDEPTRAWFQALAAATAPATAPASRPSQPLATIGEQVLLFVLQASQEKEQSIILVELVAARYNRTGGYSDQKMMDIRHELEGSRNSTGQDGELLQLLLVASRSDGGRIARTLKDSMFSATLLEQLIATGRLFWSTTNNPPLQRGASRNANFGWQVANDGSQSGSFTIEPAATAIIPLAEPWYIDAQSHTIGPFQLLNLKANEIKPMLSTPRVTLQQLSGFRQFLQQQMPGVPAPHEISTRFERVDVVPHLRFYSENAAHYRHGRPLMLNFVEPYLVVGDKNHSFFGKLPTNSSEYHDGELLIRQVNSSGIKGLRKVFSDSGFDQLQHGDDPWRWDQDYHKEWLLFDDDREPAPLEDWWQWLDTHQKRLESTGWVFEFDSESLLLRAEIEDWYGSVEEEAGGWFGFELGVVVDSKKISLIPLLVALIKDNSQLLSSQNIAELPNDTVFYPRLPDGRAIALPAERVRGMLSVLVELYLSEHLGDEKIRLSMLDAARLAAIDQLMKLRWFGAERLLALGAKLRDFSGIAAVPLPQGFAGELRPYQLQGLAWLQFLREHQLAGILADDMGLGKTAQALAHILVEREAGRAQAPTLVVAPTSLMGNWRDEATKFAPGLRVLTLHGPSRSQHFDEIPQYDLILSTYPLLARDLAHLSKHHYHLLILDEAQNIKNAKSNAAQAVNGLKAEHRLSLTGTPLENHLGELWSQFHFLMPGFLGTSESFKKGYRTPIEKHGDQGRRQALSARVRPFVLRREKSVVAKELPPKTEIIERLELEGGQRDLYETLRSSMHEQVQAEVAKNGLAKSQIMILDALLKLRQACLDPRLVKLAAAKKVKKSAKLEWFLETVPQMIEEGRKILVFSSFSSMLELLEPELQALSIPYAKLTGDTTDRPTQIHAFQNGAAKLFLITLKAGGVGLNLTAADTVIHFDPWWNPAAEDQASSRAHRIGQTKAVFVYKLVAAGSLEERILKLQARKAELARGILENSLTSSNALTQTDLDDLFAPLI
jgi:superfamily II DNA or RNA helicase